MVQHSPQNIVCKPDLLACDCKLNTRMALQHRPQCEARVRKILHSDLRSLFEKPACFIAAEKHCGSVELRIGEETTLPFKLSLAKPMHLPQHVYAFER